jgi:hypothetical protein
MITNNARCTCGIKSRIAMAKAAFNKKKDSFTRKLDLNLRAKLLKCYIWSIALQGAENWKIRKVDKKYLKSFEMWCWRRMEKIIWTDRVKNEHALYRVMWERNILHTIRRRKENWIGYIFSRTCLLKHVIERKIGRVMHAGKAREKT